MEATQRARVRFLVRDDAWSAWEATTTTEAEADAQLDAALAEYGDLRLVAAYVLELACDGARTRASKAATATRRIKVGAIEIEKAASPTSPDATNAGLWSARAGDLRAQVAAEQRDRNRPGSVVLDMEVSF